MCRRQSTDNLGSSHLTEYLEGHPLDDDEDEGWIVKGPQKIQTRAVALQTHTTNRVTTCYKIPVFPISHVQSHHQRPYLLLSTWRRPHPPTHRPVKDWSRTVRGDKVGQHDRKGYSTYGELGAMDGWSRMGESRRGICGCWQASPHTDLQSPDISGHCNYLRDLPSLYLTNINKMPRFRHLSMHLVEPDSKAVRPRMRAPISFCGQRE